MAALWLVHAKLIGKMAHNVFHLMLPSKLLKVKHIFAMETVSKDTK